MNGLLKVILGLAFIAILAGVIFGVIGLLVWGLGGYFAFVVTMSPVVVALLGGAYYVGEVLLEMLKK